MPKWRILRWNILNNFMIVREITDLDDRMHGPEDLPGGFMIP